MSVRGRGSGAITLRPAGFLGLLWGTALLGRGDALFRSVQGRDPVGVEHDAIVVLGTRHAVQGLVQVAAPTRFAPVYAAVDLTHALSMLALARQDPTRRRAALLSGAVATVSAVFSIVVARRRRGHP